MIDESIMEKIIPLPDEDEEMEKVQGELEVKCYTNVVTVVANKI